MRQRGTEQRLNGFKINKITPVKGTNGKTAIFSTALYIRNMDCPVEENLIRKKLSAMAEINALEFNLIQRVLTVYHEENALPAIVQALAEIGFNAEIIKDKKPPAVTEQPSLRPIIGAGILGLAAEAAQWFSLPDGLAALSALAAIALCGLDTYKKGWLSIKNLSFNINALMSIAVTGGLLIGQWAEAAMVMVLFTLAEMIESRSLQQARNAIEGLLALSPETATVRQMDGSWQTMALTEVPLNAVVRVKPGERIGLDGIIVAGGSTVNQAPITGESLPVDKNAGDSVFAGTINQNGSFDYRVTAGANDSTLARIIQAVENAQSVKAPTQRWVDKFARIYTPIVLMVAVLVAIVPPLWLGGIWSAWIYKALVMLVIACPCALVISTPVTVVSGLAAAARQGILIKGGVYLEQGRKLSWLALDKTGTLTHGKPVQTDMQPLADMPLARAHHLAASLAACSDHPVSQAISRAFMQAESAVSNFAVFHFEALNGRGVQGEINGITYVLGNHRLIHERGQCSATLEQTLTALERQGKTVVMLADSQQVLALFAVADTVKANSRAAISALHQLGVKTLMLTGDNQYTATAIGRQVGISRVRGNQLPQDKLNAITELSRSAQGLVGMVGDGINDAPALARADIGFAMGAMGTDSAIETADVALMDDDLGKIPQFIRISQRTHRILLQNISVALVIKAVFFALTLIGLGTMWMAVFADVGTSLLVVANGLRLLRK
ncbi:heavy metal translocating P-type ATPase [Pasteurellaceae bacterium LIM206]|nr:heavy metal translocating P-type ATPase [Pasteurellaceae bacterium LIM206]